MAGLSIIPPRKEDPALAGLPHIAKSAFSQARAYKAPPAPAKSTAGSILGQRKVQSSVLVNERTPAVNERAQSKSVATSGSRTKMSTRKQKPCRACGHEQSETGTDVGNAYEQKEEEEMK